MNEYKTQRYKEDLTNAQQRNKQQKKQLANYKKVHEKDLKEIERLNNIINELEERIVMKTNSDFIDTKVKDICCELYQILQELKGDSSNE